MTDWIPTRISVVIPTYNRPDLLAQVLAGLEAQTWPRERFEVIVVDDGGSAPAEPAVAAAAGRGLPVVGERQANAGPAAARNRGTRRATGEVVLYLDDDCRPDAALLAEHARAHDRRGLAVTGRIEWDPDLPITPLMRLAAERFLFHSHLVTVDDDAPFNTFYTANASVDREAALAAGLFDESFPRAAWEDSEFAYRLRRAGVCFRFRRDALVYHLRGLTLENFLQRERTAGYEAVRAWTKHPELHYLTGLYRIVGEADEFAFYETAARYAWLIGVAQALGYGGQTSAALDAVVRRLPAGPDLDHWRDDYVRAHERQAREIGRRQQETIEALRRRVEQLETSLAELRRDRAEHGRWAAELEQHVAEQRAALAEQARWAYQLETQLNDLTRGSVVRQVLAVLKRALD